MKSQFPSPEKAGGTRPPALAPISQNPVVPEEARALLGPSWIIEGEDRELYEALLARVGAAVEPTDIIDWLLVKDVVALTWEIQRSRRHRDSLVRMCRARAAFVCLLKNQRQVASRGTGSTEIKRRQNLWMLRSLRRDSPWRMSPRNRFQ